MPEHRAQGRRGRPHPGSHSFGETSPAVSVDRVGRFHQSCTAGGPGDTRGFDSCVSLLCCEVSGGRMGGSCGRFWRTCTVEEAGRAARVLPHAAASAGTGHPASQGLVAEHPAHGSASSAMMATGSVGSPRRSWRTLPTREMVPLVAARTGMGRYQAAQGGRSRLSSQQADGPAVWSPRPRATSSSPWSGPAPALLCTAAPHGRAPGRWTSSGQGRQGRRSQGRPRPACLSLSCPSHGRTQRPRWAQGDRVCRMA